MLVAFWQELWPGLMATVLGVIVGLPAALWLNRRFIAHAQRLERSRGEARAASVLTMLEAALADNVPGFEEIGTAVAAGLWTYDTEVDVGTWDIVREGLPGVLDDPELLGRLSNHFSRTKALLRLVAAWTHRSRTQETNADVVLRADVVRRADALRAEAKILQAELTGIVGGLDTPPPSRRIPTPPEMYLTGRRIHALPKHYAEVAREFREAVAREDLSAYFPHQWKDA